jgi:adenylosuccinate lyase
VFVTHTKTKAHQKWLEGLNLNRANFYVELEKSKEVISSQRLIIAKLEKDISNKIMTIDYLTQQLLKVTTSNVSNVNNLLDFD